MFYLGDSDERYFVATVLGMNEEIKDWLHEPVELRNHQTAEYYIEHYMDDQEKTLNPTWSLMKQFQH